MRDLLGAKFNTVTTLGPPVCLTDASILPSPINREEVL